MSVESLVANDGAMSTGDTVVVSETTTAGTTDGDSRSRNAPVKGSRRLIQPSIRKPAAKITKKKQTKKAPPRGSVRHFPCRPCVTRATRAPGHECASQDSMLGFPRPYTSYADMHGVDTGAACWDCAKTGHTCRPVPTAAHAAVRAFWDLNRQFSGVNDDPDDAWRAAALRAAQQLRACGSGAAPPAAPVPAPALDSFGEVLEKSLEERKVIALEAIAGAARLWVQLIQQGEDDEEEDEDN
ncbi:hypothetical protein BGZ61DRAFT_594246 [Ilyonectria robusta]|uniref:uncharacterized protein n=1 Tax=Ilyonectria robusta TaxID=1079257 RepID=UPI001E8E7779|nr:uncharacterized protein BGZ61DRAFT_594246 [Ilyonectria robusta]KAH8657238.1 hypothetical protein BGZ61DRAFT_594246 [Ilyonectria robusta]